MACPFFAITGKWRQILVPTGTPEPIISKLNSDIIRIMAPPNVKELVRSQGAEPRTSSIPQEFMDYVGNEITLYAKVVTAAGIKAE